MAQSAPRERQPEPAPAPEQPAGHAESPRLPEPPRSGNAQAGGTGEQPHGSTELLESHQRRTADAPLCLICGTKMRPAGSCYVCEGCGATSGCS